MKNNRSINVNEDLIKKHQISTDAPPADSLFWKMWNACQDIAEAALNSAFIQGIKNGTLDPVVYGRFNVSDAYYCFHGADDYKTAVGRTSNPVLKAFLTKKYESYDRYNATFPTTWSLKDASGIVPTEICRQYADFETKVATTQEPIYCLISMLPCEYLWAWLGAELSPAKPGNLYAPWIKGNNYPSGAYAMGNFLNTYQKENPVDEDLAMEIYQQAMTYEQQNFATVMPKK